MTSQSKRNRTDNDQCWYVLQSANNQKINPPPHTMTFSRDDLQLVGLTTWLETIDPISKGCSESGCDRTTPTILILPPQYTNSVLDAIEWFVLKLKSHHRYKNRRTKAVKIYSSDHTHHRTTYNLPKRRSQ
jgi:hypothetical protein